MQPTPTPSPADQAAADDQFLRQICLGLITMANDMAVQIHAEATAPKPPPPHPAAPPLPAPDLTIKFDRIARAIRRTALLVRSINHPAPARPTPAPITPPDPETARQQAETRQTILKSVVRQLQANRPEPRLRRDRPDRPDRPDTPDRLEHLRNRPDAELVTDILLDLDYTKPRHPLNRRPWKPRPTPNSAPLTPKRRASHQTPPDPHPPPD